MSGHEGVGLGVCVSGHVRVGSEVITNLTITGFLPQGAPGAAGQVTKWTTSSNTPELCRRCVVSKSCPTLCDPKDCSLPGSSAHRIFQARILEWVAISYSRGSS